MDEAVFSNFLPVESKFYCNATEAQSSISTKIAELVEPFQSPMETLDRAAVVYVEETDILVACCGYFRDGTRSKMGECWAQNLSLKNSAGPGPWQGPFMLQYSNKDCAIQNVGSKVSIRLLDSIGVLSITNIFRWLS